jgi:hypothetical protein
MSAFADQRSATDQPRARTKVLPVIRVLAIGVVAAHVVGVMVASQRTAASMAKAGTAFLATLSPEQQRQVSFPFESEERMKWHYIPNEMFPRQGLQIKAMNEGQRKQAHALLQTALSQAGYMTATAVMNLETILRALEQGKLARDPEGYVFSMFGTPSTDGTWGWRVDGHHLSIHVTVVKGTAVASSPTFVGANPAEVRDGPQKGLRVLGPREDAARAVLDSLDASQRTSAIFDAASPQDIITTNALAVDPLSPAGIKASALSPKQRALLNTLIGVYTSMMAEDIANERLAKLRKAGLENVTFAWAGETERGRKHYYRVQGPTFLIEYDNTQGDGNHIHSVWRDFQGDFGRDLLREHVKAMPH